MGRSWLAQLSNAVGVCRNLAHSVSHLSVCCHPVRCPQASRHSGRRTYKGFDFGLVILRARLSKHFSQYTTSLCVGLSCLLIAVSLIKLHGRVSRPEGGSHGLLGSCGQVYPRRNREGNVRHDLVESID